MSDRLEIILNAGKGKRIVLLCDEDRHKELAAQVGNILAESFQVILISAPPVVAGNWEDLYDALVEALDDLRARQAVFVVFGGASALVSNLYLENLKRVRMLVLVDATTRPHPSPLDRAIDWCESSLPMGLPFRTRSKGFDVKPFLQRIRCPVLVVSSALASSYERSERDVFAENLPTAWAAELDGGTGEASLVELIGEFQDVKVKCPQKNVQNARPPQQPHQPSSVECLDG